MNESNFRSRAEKTDSGDAVFIPLSTGEEEDLSTGRVDQLVGATLGARVGIHLLRDM